MLVNARYDLNPFEMKLILNALTEIKTEDRQFFSKKISVKQLEKELKVKINPTQLKEQCIELFKSRYTYQSQQKKEWQRLFNS